MLFFMKFHHVYTLFLLSHGHFPTLFLRVVFLHLLHAQFALHDLFSLCSALDAVEQLQVADRSLLLNHLVRQSSLAFVFVPANKQCQCNEKETVVSLVTLDFELRDNDRVGITLLWSA